MQLPFLIHIKYKQTYFKIFLLFTLALTLGSTKLIAQDAFLACAQFEDREIRLDCLDAALSEVIESRQTKEAVETTVNTVNSDQEAIPVGESIVSTVAVVETASNNEQDIQAQLDKFGESNARLIEGEDGEQELIDTVSELKRSGDLLRITLSSGQVWEQSYPRFYNLRKNDVIKIYREGFGDGFRLSTERLNGFIRVKKLR